MYHLTKAEQAQLQDTLKKCWKEKNRENPAPLIRWFADVIVDGIFDGWERGEVFDTLIGWIDPRAEGIEYDIYFRQLCRYYVKANKSLELV